MIIYSRFGIIFDRYFTFAKILSLENVDVDGFLKVEGNETQMMSQLS